ncbi:twin-arginine translocation signal domain-containing protein, partial [Micromonospora chalcea]
MSEVTRRNVIKATAAGAGAALVPAAWSAAARAGSAA